MASGRKKAFSENEALQCAMEVFWAKGYIGSSLADLTQSMGINKPSMYSAFGNKEALFIKTTQLYIDSNANKHFKLLTQTGASLAERLKNYMVSIVVAQCEGESPKGCYLVLCQSELVGGGIPAGATELLNSARHDSQEALVQLFTNDAQSKTLGLNEHATNNALCIITTLRGTATMARAGSTFAQLECVIDNSLRGIGFNA